MQEEEPGEVSRGQITFDPLLHGKEFVFYCGCCGEPQDDFKLRGSDWIYIGLE